jgi:hypothetical protein
MQNMTFPIFICGTGRSGTSFLNSFLSSLPSIFGLRYEGRFIVLEHGLLELCDRSKPDEIALNTFVAKMQGEWFYKEVDKGDFIQKIGLHKNFSREHVEKVLSEFVNEYLSSKDVIEICFAGHQFLCSLFEMGVKEKNAQRWIEKTPANLVFIDKLSKIIPEARFLHIVRDPRDVAASIMSRDFWPIGRWAQDRIGLVTGKKTAANCGKYWRAVIEFGRECARKIPQGHYLEFKYEDLIFDIKGATKKGIKELSSKNTLQKIFDFIEEPLNKRALRGVEVHTDSIGRYRKYFSETDVNEIAENAGQAMNQFGYC